MVTHLRPGVHESFAACYYPVMTPLKSANNLEFLEFPSFIQISFSVSSENTWCFMWNTL